MADIYILSGAVHSGKTTALEKLVAKHPGHFSGVLCPIIEGKRKAYLIHEARTLALEVINSPQKQVLTVGKYHFSKKSFEQVNKSIIDVTANTGKIIIFDEIGPLELNRSGIYESFQWVINCKKPSQKALLVVREKLLEEITQFFNLEPIKIFSGKNIHTIENFF